MKSECYIHGMCYAPHNLTIKNEEDVTMKYYKLSHLQERMLVAATWAFWVLTFSLGFMIAKLTF